MINDQDKSVILHTFKAIADHLNNIKELLDSMLRELERDE